MVNYKSVRLVPITEYCNDWQEKSFMSDDFIDPQTGLKSIISLDTQSAFRHTLPSKIQNYGRVAIYAYIRYKFSRFFRYQDRLRSFSN